MSRQLSEFLEVGFHGDKYLLELVFAAARRCEQFVETGTNVGSSICYLARHFPKLPCYSCEPDKESCEFARRKAAPFPNAQINHEPSPQFLHTLAKQVPGLASRETLFWLDSHGYGFRWPLREEVEFITTRFDSACIFIDDFKVPGQPQFLFDEYDGQICGMELIAGSLAKKSDYRFILPDFDHVRPRRRAGNSRRHPGQGHRFYAAASRIISSDTSSLAPGDHSLTRRFNSSIDG
jgi:hypothetical protein